MAKQVTKRRLLKVWEKPDVKEAYHKFTNFERQVIPHDLRHSRCHCEIVHFANYADVLDKQK